MVSTIWKYPLQMAEWQIVEMPEGAEIVHVGEQSGTLCLWARVDPSRLIKWRRIVIVGTGHLCPDAPSRFIGTVLLQGGALVLHVMEDNTPLGNKEHG